MKNFSITLVSSIGQKRTYEIAAANKEAAIIKARIKAAPTSFSTMWYVDQATEIKSQLSTAA